MFLNNSKRTEPHLWKTKEILDQNNIIGFSSGKMQLQLNSSKMKELIVDFSSTVPALTLVSIEGRMWRYFTPMNTWSAYGKKSELEHGGPLWGEPEPGYFLQRLSAISICSGMLQMLYQPAVAITIFYFNVCSGQIRSQEMLTSPTRLANCH